MPRRAPHPCSFPGCPVLVRAGRSKCAAHEVVRRRESDARRGSAASRGYDRRWRKVSKLWLDEEPARAWCGCGAPATLVDHIVPHRGDVELFWDESNWQGMCESCHNAKTACGF